MTMLKPREFYDELDREFQIKMYIKRPRYYNILKNLVTYFSAPSIKSISISQYQQSFCIPDKSSVYFVFEGLYVLGVLHKIGQGQGSKTVYIPNPLYWDLAKKEIEKNGSSGPDKGMDSNP